MRSLFGVLYILFLIQLPTNAPGKTAADSLVPATCCGKPGSWLQPGADLPIVAIWGVTWWMKDQFIFLSIFDTQHLKPMNKEFFLKKKKRSTLSLKSRTYCHHPDK